MGRTLYSIKNWRRHFEKAQSRELKGDAKWVPLPTKHDGLGYRRLIRMPNGPALYGAWVLIVQVAAKCDERGVLKDDAGPLDHFDLETKTGCPAALFLDALNVLSSNKIGWILGESWEDDTTALPLQDRTKQDTTGQDKTLAPLEGGCNPPALVEWIDWWNGLRAEGLVPVGADPDPPSQALQKAFTRVSKSAALRALWADRDRVAFQIRSASFCQEPWFRPEKLLAGKNRDGELIVKKLLEGGFADGKQKRRGTVPIGPGQRHDGEGNGDLEHQF